MDKLRLDYEDFLRQRKLPLWDSNDARRREPFRHQFNTADQFVLWVKHQNQKQLGNLPKIAANGILALLSVTCSLLDKRILLLKLEGNRQ